nr:hypothetical protein [uncultured bacterium]
MSATPATLVIDKAFSAYLAYSTAPTEAALLELLAELKMLDETLALTANRNTFLAFPEYQALNALLDHARYVGDARNVIRLRSLLGTPLESEIGQACLVSRTDCHAALLNVGAAHRICAKRAVFKAFRQWGPVLDIHPAVLNCTVKAFELLRATGLKGEGTAFQVFEETYDYQAEHDLPHLVPGVVACKESEEQKLLGLMTNLYLAETSLAGA